MGDVLRDFFKNLRGWMIFVAIILLLGFLLSAYGFLASTFLRAELGGYLLPIFNSADLGYTNDQVKYLAISYLTIVLSFVAQIYLVFSFVRRKRNFPMVFLVVLFLGAILTFVDAVASQVYLGELQNFGPYGFGVVFAFGMLQYMQRSPRGKAFFVK